LVDFFPAAGVERAMDGILVDFLFHRSNRTEKVWG
jgi:hypothetical protein